MNRLGMDDGMSIDTKTIRDLYAKRGDHPWGSSFEHAAYQHMPELLDAYDRLSELEAARHAYASEFPLNADGEPDVGNIHQNIRALLQRLAELEAELASLRTDRDGAARCSNWSTDESRGLDAQRRIAELEQQLAAAQAEVRELCPEVIAFAHLMQHKLNMNAHKDGEGWGRDSSGKRGWKSCSPQFLMDKLYEEVLELTIAIHEGDSAKSIRQEAADVGNIAMMLADVCGALSRHAEQHDPLAVSDHCGECGEPEPECACDERIEDYRESRQEGKE